MTVGELISVLQKYDSTTRVVVAGYEKGYADITEENICPIQLVLNYNKADWYGPHEDIDDYWDPNDREMLLASVRAIRIS